MHSEEIRKEIRRLADLLRRSACIQEEIIAEYRSSIIRRSKILRNNEEFTKLRVMVFNIQILCKHPETAEDLEQASFNRRCVDCQAFLDEYNRAEFPTFVNAIGYK